uniref:Recep_L_domain domain-containing protein n=1 Tax=Heterorhabditis bacteriophora TaxID=37862 RepID=A0A1I7WBU6_HETBA
MLSDDLRPPPPPRTASSGVQSKVTFEGAQSWRESVAIILCFGLCISVFISVICLSVYVWRDKAVYEELIDYLDKTISISKINYNHLLGLYQLNDKEIEVLGDQRMLLNHAIPHNPGGLLQMEQRLGCTFDHNLYAANKRRLNPRNSCDPQIESSFLPSVIIILLLVLRLLPIVVCALLLSKRTPLSESVAQLVEKTRPVQRKPRSHNNKLVYFDGSGTPLPPMPSPSQVDHSIR